MLTPLLLALPLVCSSDLSTASITNPSLLPLVAPFELINQTHLQIDGNMLQKKSWNNDGNSKMGQYTQKNFNFYVKENPPRYFESILASSLLKLFDSGPAQRFPTLTLGYDQKNKAHVFSQEMLGFQSLKSFPYYQQVEIFRDALDDLPNLYVRLYLVGGGDPHPGNIIYNQYYKMFGSVDLDVAFKIHISVNDPNKDALEPTHHDLALRDLDCTKPCINFLQRTDSKIDMKANWQSTEYYRFQNPPFSAYQMSPTTLIHAMAHLAQTPWHDVKNNLTTTISTLRVGAQRITQNVSLDFPNPDHYYSHFVKSRYDEMQYMANAYQTWVDSLDPQEKHDVTIDQITKWCHDFHKDQNKQPHDEF